MRSNKLKAYVAAAAVVGLAIVLHGFLAGERFTLVRMDDNAAMRIDHWTGETTLCAQWQDDSFWCAPETEGQRPAKVGASASK